MNAGRSRCGFTLIELLVAASIIVILAALLIPSLGIVRERAKREQARQVLNGLFSAFELYANEDPRRQYPDDRDADWGLERDVLEIFDDRGLWSVGGMQWNDDKLLLDPWFVPYRYSLERPAPTEGAEIMDDWNWDKEEDRVRRWGIPAGKGFGKTTEEALPFPYLWSITDRAHADNARHWIITEGGR